MQLSGSERGERAGRKASHKSCTDLGLEEQHHSDRLASSRHSHHLHHRSTDAAVDAASGDQPCNSSSLSAKASGT